MEIRLFSTVEVAWIKLINFSDAALTSRKSCPRASNPPPRSITSSPPYPALLAWSGVAPSTSAMFKTRLWPLAAPGRCRSLPKRSLWTWDPVPVPLQAPGKAPTRARTARKAAPDARIVVVTMTSTRSAKKPLTKLPPLKLFWRNSTWSSSSSKMPCHNRENQGIWKRLKGKRKWKTRTEKWLFHVAFFGRGHFFLCDCDSCTTLLTTFLHLSCNPNDLIILFLLMMLFDYCFRCYFFIMIMKYTTTTTYIHEYMCCFELVFDVWSSLWC